MANVFSGDTNCVALWRFESGALTADSIGGNTLTDSGTVASDTSDFKEGAGCADFEQASSQRMYITDANLDADFPLKNGTSNNVLSVCFWVKFESAGINIFSKGATGGSDASVGLAFSSGSLFRFLIGYNSGASVETIAHGTAGTTGRWYHIGATFNDADKSYRIRIWDDTAGAIHGTDKTGTATNNINIEAGQFDIGIAANGYSSIDARIDEFVVFKDILTADEIDAIRSGTYGASAVKPWNYYAQSV